MSELTPTVGEAAIIGNVLRNHDRHARNVLAATRRSVEGTLWDMVAVVRYETHDREGYRWAVVQRVGFQWSCTLDLDAEDARTRSLAIARRSNAVESAGDARGAPGA